MTNLTIPYDTTHHAWLTPICYEGTHRTLLSTHSRHQGRVCQFALMVFHTPDGTPTNGSLLAEPAVIVDRAGTSTTNVVPADDGETITVTLVDSDGTSHTHTAHVTDQAQGRDPRLVLH